MAHKTVIEFLRKAGRKGGNKHLQEKGIAYFRRLGKLSGKKRSNNKKTRVKPDKGDKLRIFSTTSTN